MFTYTKCFTIGWFLNQARAWLPKIIFVQMSVFVCVCVYVCVPTPEAINK